MDQFRRLMQVALGSGALCGFLLFLVQYLMVRPLILTAESYEHAADMATNLSQGVPAEGVEPAESHHDEGWQPSEGFERTALTGVATTLMGVGFSAILFGTAALTGTSLNARLGILWGLIGFASFTLAPALGLPPVPPGAGVADVAVRQMWWSGTVVATAAGIWMMARGQNRLMKVLGAVTIFIPHIVGAPAAIGPDVVPPALIQEFALTSVATDAFFWLLLGAFGGYLSGKSQIC